MECPKCKQGPMVKDGHFMVCHDCKYKILLKTNVGGFIQN